MTRLGTVRSGLSIAILSSLGLFILVILLALRPVMAQESAPPPPPPPPQDSAAPPAPDAQETKAEEMKASNEATKAPAPATEATKPGGLTPEQIKRAIEAPGPYHPPKTGRMVGDHWTPYTPPDPESFAKGSQVYIIEKGNTLWDLSERFLQTPWLWPQIWDVNQYITESHWIYPGDPLLIPGAPTVIGEEPAAAAPSPAPTETAQQAAEVTPPAEEMEPEMAETQPAPPAMPPPPALVPIAAEHDLYCSNYISAAWEAPALFIEEREEGAKTELANGDIVFLSQGEQQGVKPGAVYSIIAPEHEVKHPIREEDSLGTSVLHLGRVRVLAVQPSSATAEIMDACDAVAVGDYLVPFQEVPVPLSAPVAFSQRDVTLTGQNDGYIVHVMDDKYSFGQGDIVNIDMGTGAGIQPGDVFTVFREWGGTVEFYSPESYIEGQQQRAERMKSDGGETKFSQVILGQLVVLASEEKTSTAKVLVAVKEMAIGDRVELR